MRRLVMGAMVALFVLAGCTPGGDPVPSGTVVDPVVESTTPTPSPTPTWSDTQQGAIDAVQRYLEVWTGISQNLYTADWNDIRLVAGDPVANNDMARWSRWVSNGWHLVGGPIFTPDRVVSGMQDYLGNRYHVYGCYVKNDVYIVDDAGTPAGPTESERWQARYVVIHWKDGEFSVLEDHTEEGTC